MSTCPQCRTEYPPNVRICTVDGTVLDEAADADQTDPNVGTLLAGKYRLDALLGRGGMGAVYRATHVMLGKTVAVKMIKPDLVGSPEMARRFQREARAATSLDHPNIVAVYDLGQAEDGALYIAMEFVQGQSLKDVIRLGGPMEPARIARLLAQIASALAKAHGRQVVHRDLKPHNLVLTIDAGGQECIKLLDFGIAKTFEEGATQLTAAGYALGTPQYMAPEQATGQEVDGRADIYALGVILYEMLVGDVPFNAPSTPAILVKHMTEPPQAPSLRRPGTHPVLETVALRCLEKDPERRYQSAQELGAALREAFPHDPVMPVAGFADAPTMTRTGPSVAGTPLTTNAVTAGTTPAQALIASEQASALQTPGDVSSPAQPAGPASSLPPVSPAATPPATGTRPTVRIAEPAVANAVAANAPKRRSGGVGRLLLVIGIVSVLLLVAVGASGYAVYRAWFAGASTAEQSTVDEAPPVSVPAMAREETSQPPPAQDTGGAAVARQAEIGAPAVQAGPSSAVRTQPHGETAAAATALQRPPARTLTPEAEAPARMLTPEAETPARTLQPEASAAANPLPTAALPEVPAVLVDCSGAADVCGAVRAAFDQMLERHRMPSIRRADRAHVVVAVEANLVDTSHDQQFGTSFAVQTFSLEASAETSEDGEAIGMPPSRTFSFDPRFGRERVNENARVLAGEAVERIQRFWKARGSR